MCTDTTAHASADQMYQWVRPFQNAPIWNAFSKSAILNWKCRFHVNIQQKGDRSQHRNSDVNMHLFLNKNGAWKSFISSELGVGDGLGRIDSSLTEKSFLPKKSQKIAEQTEHLCATLWPLLWMLGNVFICADSVPDLKYNGFDSACCLLKHHASSILPGKIARDHCTC